MSILGQSAGLLFKIDADASGAKKELAAMDTAVGKLGGQFDTVGGTAAVAAAGIAALGAAALTAGRVIFDLIKTTSDYGSAIFEASQKTGLTATTLSALQVAAEQSGSSLEAITQGIARFARSYKGSGANLEVELGKVFEQIKNASSGFERLKIAQAAFGKSGAELIPVILATGGNLKAFTAEMERLGVTIDDQAARASDQFGDTLDTLGTQAAAVGRKFALELMPMVTGALQSISQWMTANQGVATHWGFTVKTAINDIDRGANALGNSYANVLNSLTTGMVGHKQVTLDWAAGAKQAILSLFPPLLALSELGRLVGWLDPSTVVASGEGVWNSPVNSPAAPPTGQSQRAPKKAAVEKRDDSASRDLAAAIALEKRNLETIKEQMSQAFEDLRKIFAADSDEESFFENSNATIVRFADALQTSLSFLDELENRSRSTMTENEKALLTAEQLERREQARAAGKAELKKNEAKIVDVQKEEYKIGAELIEQDTRRNDARLEALATERAARKAMADEALGRIALGIAGAIGTPQGEDGEGGIFDSWTESWMNFLGAVEFGAPTLTATMTEVSGILQNAFQGMANALGQVVQQWVLYGETGPGVMRKVLASALATIAAEAAVRAIYSAAMGFFFLATHQYTDATNAFISAAVFGSIAGVAAVAGRAVAGNAFKQQSSAGATAGTTTRSTSTQGGAYSGSDTMTINGGRNAPEGQGGALVIRDKSGMFDSLFEIAWERNGRMRQTLRAEFAT